MAKKIIHPRLHVIFASEGTTAIILCRGPGRKVCTFLWNRATDDFTTGQFLKGRIYEDRCDLSPDGKHFIYFAYDGRTSISWTGISRTPDLKTIDGIEGHETWNGGGHFTSNSTFWLNRIWYEENKEPLTMVDLKEDPEFPDKHAIGRFPNLYSIRLQRDGWKRGPDQTAGDDRMLIFEKALPGKWILEKTFHSTISPPQGKGSVYDTHRLIHPDSGQVLDLPNWEWADLDGDRLVWAEKGLLRCTMMEAEPPRSSVLLHDFTSLNFESIQAAY